MIRQCKDCKYCRSNVSTYVTITSCMHEKNCSPADGLPRLSANFLRDQDWFASLLYGYCGRRARWFVPKEVK